jgi:hypothetical protein
MDTLIYTFGIALGESVRDRLQSLRDLLASTPTDPWSGIEQWTAHARPFFRARLETCLPDFEKETAQPAWVMSPRMTSNFDEVEAIDRELNAKIASNAKARILSFLDGVLATLSAPSIAAVQVDSTSLSKRLSELLTITQQGVVAVPATRYALGAAGIGASAAIVLAVFAGRPVFAVFGVTLGVVFAIVVLVFARLAEHDPATFFVPARILMWVTICLFSTSLVLVFTSVFFDIPLPLKTVIFDGHPLPPHATKYIWAWEAPSHPCHSNKRLFRMICGRETERAGGSALVT